jgi:probable HAF family extracellular repeat protein
VHPRYIAWHLLVVGLLACEGWALPSGYALVDLGGTGVALNNQRQIVGQFSATVSPGVFRTMPFRAPSAPLDPARDNLGMPGAYEGRAQGINDAGAAVGYAKFTGQIHAFRVGPTGKLADPGSDLGTLGGSESAGCAINASGQVAGWADTAGGGRHAFRMDAEATGLAARHDLGTLGGRDSSACSMNAAGQVVGNAYLAGDSVSHAFRTSATGRVSDPGTDLGTLGGSSSTAYDINDQGQAVGAADVAGNGGYHAFRTAPGGRVSDPGTDLGTLGGAYSQANAINNAGTVVGWATLPPAGTFGLSAWHAFILAPGGLLLDLNQFIDPATGWTLAEAVDINELGQILARGMRDPDGAGPLGQSTGYCVLTPIPEPTSLLLLVLAALAVRPARNRA